MNPLVTLVGGILKWAIAKLALVGIGYRKAIADRNAASLEAAKETNDDREAVAPMSGDTLDNELRDTLK